MIWTEHQIETRPEESMFEHCILFCFYLKTKQQYQSTLQKTQEPRLYRRENLRSP